jgi:hypothetical protein
LRRANTAEGQDWILQPVLPRQDRFTKAIHRLLRGGKMCRGNAIPTAPCI